MSFSNQQNTVPNFEPTEFMEMALVRSFINIITSP